MIRDLSRLRAIGMDGLILALSPEFVTDPVRTERVCRFVELFERSDGVLRHLVLMLMPPAPGTPFPTRESLGKWIVDNRLHSRQCIRKTADRIQLFLAPGVTLTGAPHPVLTTAATGASGSSWTWGEPGDPKRLEPAGAERQVLVYAGSRGQGGRTDAEGTPLWELPRDGGKAIDRELASAYAVRAGLICVSSWNDYVAGDFIEPNTLDGEAVSRRLAAAIRRARQASN